MIRYITSKLITRPFGTLRMHREAEKDKIDAEQNSKRFGCNGDLGTPSIGINRD